MKRALVVSNEHIGREMAGPGIRYYEFARHLAANFDVTLVTPNHPDVELDGIGTVHGPQLGFSGFKALADSVDVIVAQQLSPRAMRYVAGRPVRVIYDLYCPFLTENLAAFAGQGGPLRRRDLAYRATTLVQELALATGDAFICASEAQRDLWLGYLGALGRIRLGAYSRDPTLAGLVRVVPFGLDPAGPNADRRALRGVVPGIEQHDKVLLWGGGVWNWFDPLTLIRAVGRLAERRDDVKLYFLGVKHPNPETLEMEMVGRAVALADELGLRDRCVFFNFGWVPYSERAEYLLDADLGVSTHYDTVETRFAFRTRLLDYFWAGLPTVTTEGDVLAGLVEQRALGRTVGYEDVEGWVRAIADLVDSPEEVQLVKRNLAAVRKELAWPRVVEPLIELANGAGAAAKSRRNVWTLSARQRVDAGRSFLAERGALETVQRVLASRTRTP